MNEQTENKTVEMSEQNITPRPFDRLVILSLPFLDSIVCSDNVEAMKQLPDECIDLTVTSPPYDDLRTYGGHSWDFEAVAKELFRVTKTGGVVVWVVSDKTIDGSETLTSMRQALFFKDLCGFNMHDTMIYKKKYIPLTHNRYEQGFEYMFVLAKPGKVICNHIMVPRKYPDKRCVKQFGRRNKGPNDAIDFGYAKQSETVIRDNVWALNNRGDDHLGHPAPFPEKLAHDHIISWSNEGDIVLDPFSGSGTTCKMARILKRHWIGIEINPEYVEISKKRMAQGVLGI